MSIVRGTRKATVDAIVATLQAEFGGEVRRGVFARPVGPFPFVAVGGSGVRSEQSPPRYWTRRASVEVDVWEASGQPIDDRVALAEELADRATNALEAAFADSTNELYQREGFAVESSAIDGMDLVPDGFARAFLVVSFDYRERGA